MRRIASIIVIAALCLLTFALSLCIGENGLSISQLLNISSLNSDSVEYIIFSELRLPRTLIALSVGALLGASGIIMQTVFRNPLVEPYTLGVSGGALVGVAICISMGLSGILNGNGNMIFALLGSLASIFFIANPFSIGFSKQTSSSHILLSGIVFSFVSSAITTLLLSLSTREQMSSIISWSIGGFEGVSTGVAYSCTTIALVFLALAPFLGNLLNILLLGSVDAHTLGIRTSIFVPVVLAVASCLSAVCVASAGVIAFVGMVVPHFTVALVGQDRRFSLPCSMLIGASILLLCDIVARHIIFPQELPVGVITGLLGGIMFLWINYRKA
ncbi:MAG: iron ABC transporter permease [Bacteroidales bacterium]|nr:iron ABC transporter permease [Bacteroidales bacterium]